MKNSKYLLRFIHTTLILPIFFIALKSQAQMCRDTFLQSKSTQKKVQLREKLASTALQIAVIESEAYGLAISKELFALSESYLASIPEHPEDRKAKILTSVKQDHLANTRTLQFQISFLEFATRGLSRRRETFTHNRAQVIKGIVLSILNSGIDQGRFTLENMFNVPKLIAFFAGEISRSNDLTADVVWSKIKQEMNRPDLATEFKVSATEAASIVIQTISPFLQEAKMQRNLTSRLDAFIQFFEAKQDKSASEVRSLRIAKVRKARIEQLSVLEFIDSYLQSESDLFDAYFLPIHKAALESYRNLTSSTWVTQISPPRSIDLDMLKDQLEKRRPKEKLNPIFADWIPKNLGPLLVASKPLGSGSKASVFMASFNANQADVVFKKYFDKSEFGIAVFEYFFTTYCTAVRNYSMPKILARSPETGMLVKEYVHGLRMDELESIYGEGSPQMNELYRALEVEREIIKHISSGFDDWFETTYLYLSRELTSRHPYLLVGKDFHRDENWIFSPSIGRWILHDP